MFRCLVFIPVYTRIPGKLCILNKMDDLSVGEFLSQIGPQFEQYAEYFLRHKFCNVASLRCLEIPQDINYIFGEILSLGEKRQIEYALRELKNVQKNDATPTPMMTVDKDDQCDPGTSALHKIATKLEDKIKIKQLQLIETEEELQQLEMPIDEPSPQGNMSTR